MYTEFIPGGHRDIYSNGRYVTFTRDGRRRSWGFMEDPYYGVAMAHHEQRAQNDERIAYTDQNRILSKMQGLLKNLQTELGNLKDTRGPVVGNGQLKGWNTDIRKIKKEVDQLIHPGDGGDSD